MLVGIIANPYSSKDVRRLVGLARVVDIEEKANMVARLLAGLGGGPSVGVVALNDGAGLMERGVRLASGRAPPVRFLDLTPEGSEEDTRRAAAAFAEKKAYAVIAVGGDGTLRAVVEGWPRVCLVPVAAGTNNAISLTIDPTVIGLATARASDPAVAARSFRPRSRLMVETVSGVSTAMVDVVATRRHWTGARAMWDPDDLLEAVVTVGNPTAVGVASVAAGLGPLAPGWARHVRFGTGKEVMAVLAPGLVTRIGVSDFYDIAEGGSVVLSSAAGTLAFDGERTVISGSETMVSIVPGPRILDPEAALTAP